jgi:iron-sulfur cluster repair protein YtfE (RIC family)
MDGMGHGRCIHRDGSPGRLPGVSHVMTTLSAHVLRAIEEEHRDLAEQIAELLQLLDPRAGAGSITEADIRAWAARLRGELHHLSPRLERHFQREERHFRLLVGDHPALATDLEMLKAEHDGFREVMAELLARILGAEEPVRGEISSRLLAFAADLSEHERREMEVLRRLK